MATSTTLNESLLLEDDKTMPSAIGPEIDEVRSQFLLSPKRKLAETVEIDYQPPPTEKRNRGDETEEQKPPPLGKQQGGGGCECKGGECECEGESEDDMSMDELPDDIKEYFKRVWAIHGREIGVGTLGRGARDEEDSDDEQIGHLGDMLDDPEIAKIWCEPDPVMCSSHPFNSLDFKQNTELYNGLKLFGGKAVDYLSAVYNYGEAPCFQDIERVTSCHAPCKHRVVTLNAKDRSDRVWDIVLRGRLPPGVEGFAEANPREFHLLQYCYV